MEQTTGGGFLGAGGFNATNFFFMASRFDSAGNFLTQYVARSTNQETAFACQAVADGLFLGGDSNSGPGADKTSPNYGTTDYWLVRFDVSGRVVWDADLGGTLGDYLGTLTATPDGGCLVGGQSFSQATGNKTTPHYGAGDMWAVLVDSHGNKVWDQSFGGTGQDDLRTVLATRNGGYLLAGFSSSTISGNKTSPRYGSWDFWVIKLDSNLTKVWEQTYGGASGDVLWTARETFDGGFICAGRSSSEPGGNKTSPYYGGGGDYWAVRLDANGQKLWDASFGGTNYDECRSVLQTPDGGFLLAGSSMMGGGGNKSSFGYGDGDYWLVRLDANGQKLWDVSLGGTNYDDCRGVCQTPDGGWVLGGFSSSGATGSKTTTNSGGYDVWLVKLDGDDLTRPPRLRWELPSHAGQPYRLLLQGSLNQVYRTEVSTSMSDWVPYRTNQIFGTEVEVLAGSLTAAPLRFFRAVRMP